MPYFPSDCLFCRYYNQSENRLLFAQSLFQICVNPRALLVSSNFSVSAILIASGMPFARPCIYFDRLLFLNFSAGAI